jgi:hypothetical protein
VQNIQYQGAVLNGFTEVGEGVSHAFHLAAVVVNGEHALGEGAELGVEEHGARLAVVEELLLEPELGDTSGDPIAIVDDVQKVGGDHVDQP